MIFLVIPPNVVSESQYCSVGCPCRSWLTTVSFIFIPNTSCFPELFQERPDNDCEFAGRISPGEVPPELSLSEDYRFRCKICLHNLSPLLQCIELLDPLMLWDENLRLYLWFTWKWERYVSYCGTGKNLIRVTFFWPTLYIYDHGYDSFQTEKNENNWIDRQLSCTSVTVIVLQEVNNLHVVTTGARGTDHLPFSNFPFVNLFSIKLLYFFIISPLFPYFNLFVSVFIQSYVNIKLHVSTLYRYSNWMCRPYIDTRVDTWNLMLT
jgi:hypothetical protein